MESSSSNEESHFISVDGTADEESHVRKKPKKTSSVRFAPEVTSIKPRIFPKDGDIDLENLTEEDIKTEICSCLPSNTLGRRRLRSFNKSQAAKAYTFPRQSSSDDQEIPMTRLRPQSFVTNRKPSFLRSLGRLSSKRFPYDTEEEYDVTDELESCFTEEERRDELLNIRNIPVRLSEKKKYREAILETFPIHGSKDKSIWSKVKNSCACLRRISSAFEIWNGTLKSIEGQQGTGVVSYFVFLRWLIALNMILLFLYLLLVILPHTAFVFLPLKEITTAPNHTVIDEKFLSQFPRPTKRTELKMERRNNSLKLSDSELFSNLGELLDKYLVENTLDITLSYNKENWTTKERHNLSRFCESRYTAEMLNRTDGFLSVIQDLLQGTGWLQSTVLFLGYYSASEISCFGLPYDLPVAIIFVLFLSFVVCLTMMTQYSSHGAQETIIARKSDYLVYSNLLFCSWDYCIEDKKSSIIRHSSILHEMKSTLNEERRKRDIKEWSRGKKFQVYFLRCFINIFVVCILFGSYYLLYKVVKYQLDELQLHRLNDPGVSTLFVQYLSPIVITCLNIFLPIIFTNIVKFEMYNTQTQINIALFRIVFLRLSSVFALVWSLDKQITCQPKDMCLSGISPTCRSPICWETYVGQQFYKLAVTDFFVYIIMFIAYDFPRDVIVRRFNNKVTQLVGRQTFDLPNQVLALVYSQTLCWLGIIYSPLLPLITVIKFVILFHIKKIMVLRYCIPAPIPYKASRSNAMFMMILMLSFFSIMIIHAYTLSFVEPSPACSPFRHYAQMQEAVTNRFPTFDYFIRWFFSAIFLVPAILFMCIAIYYYWTIIVANRKMSKVLKAQIMLEGRDKQFLLNRLTEVAKGHI